MKPIVIKPTWVYWVMHYLLNKRKTEFVAHTEGRDTAIFVKHVFWYTTKKNPQKNLLHSKQFLLVIANIFIACRHFLKIFPILLGALAHMFLPLHRQCFLELLLRNFLEDLLDGCPYLSFCHKPHTT